MRWMKIVIFIMIIMTNIYADGNRIAVLDFKSENVSEPELKVITDRMRTSMVKYDFLKVMERGEIKDLLKEQSFQYQDYFSNEEAVKAGRMVGANYILAGSVQELENSYYVSARLIEVETTTTYAQQDVIVDNKRFAAILARIPDLADKIVDQFANKKDIKIEDSVKEDIAAEQSDISEKPEETVRPDIASESEKVEYQGRKGGFGPCVSSCLIGPRVGLEMNEGIEIRDSEWVGFAGSFIPYVGFVARGYMAYDMGYKTNEIRGCIASYFLGPRVGHQLHYRRIREKEWMRLIPCINIFAAFSISMEAYRGETMTEIAKREGLRK